MADVASAVVGYLCVCLSQLGLDAAEPESAADLLDGSVLACILRVVTGPSGPGASDLASKPSLASVTKALIAQVTQDRCCSPGDAAKALQSADGTDEERALNLAVITIVLAVTCDDRGGFIECIHELNDDTATALQQAVQGGMELLPGIDEQAGEAGSAKAGAGSPGSSPAGRADRGADELEHDRDGEEDEDSVDVLRAENKALRRETESLRQQLALGGGPGRAGDSAAGAAGEEEDEGEEGEDGALHKDMSVHLYKQVAQLEAALELAQAQRDEADADVARLRDDLDISRAAVVDIHRVRKELEEARAEAALLQASVAEAERGRAEAEARVEAMDKATEADAARASSEMQELRKKLKQAEHLHREGKFELAGVQTKANAASEEVSRLRKLLEATKEAKNVAEARAAAAEASASSGRAKQAPSAVASAAASGMQSVAAETSARAEDADAAAATAKQKAEVAMLRAELRRKRTSAAAGDDEEKAAEADAEAAVEDERLGKLQAQLAEAEARAIRAESDAEEWRSRGEAEATGRLRASEAEARAAKAEVDAMKAQLRTAREEFEASVAAAQEEADEQRKRAEALQSQRIGLEQAASELASMRARLKEAHSTSEAMSREAERLRRKLREEAEHSKIEADFARSGLYNLGKAVMLANAAKEASRDSSSAAAPRANRLSFMRRQQAKASPVPTK